MTQTFIPQEVIRRKRDNHELTIAEIGIFVQHLASGELGNEQVGAFAMAVFLNGMADAETVALTKAMRDSGQVLEWSGLQGPVIDKHSTGGVGDKLSLLIAPILAECGAFVPMISGRGLGHTGGTLDKLDSIPGYNSTPSLETLRTTVRDVGCAIVGQTNELAPADRRLYAIRDVTATVESIPLITSSILSKKLAAGLDVLVMDVKYGSGAFMVEFTRAQQLAQTIVNVAGGAGVRCSAILSDMGRCLGRTAGNALEVLEAVQVLKGEIYDRDMIDLSLALCAEALAQADLASNQKQGMEQAKAALQSGKAAERFARMIEAMGGPSNFVENPERHLSDARSKIEVLPLAPGHVSTIDARALGLAVLSLGGGRTAADQPIDPSVGLSAVRKPGEFVDIKEPLAIVHARNSDTAQIAADQVRAAFTLDQRAPAKVPRIAQIISTPRRENGSNA